MNNDTQMQSHRAQYIELKNGMFFGFDVQMKHPHKTVIQIIVTWLGLARLLYMGSLKCTLLPSCAMRNVRIFCQNTMCFIDLMKCVILKM